MSSCKLSLEYKDFDRYDVVADKKLHRSEMTDEQFECFVEQLVRTGDREIRQYFVEAIQNKLWEEIRYRLKRMLQSASIEPVIKKRIKTLLDHEFTKSVASGSASTSYSFDYYHKRDRRGEIPSKHVEKFHSLSGQGILKLNIPLNKWRILSNIMLEGSSRWSSIAHTLGGENDSSTSSRFGGVSSRSDIAIYKRDSRVKLNAAAYANKRWNAPADKLSSEHSLSSSATLSNLFGSALTLFMSGEISGMRYAAPLDPSYIQKSYTNRSAKGTASYLFGQGGIIGTYNYKNIDNATNFYREYSDKHIASALAHIRLKKGFFRVGGGGGVWREDFKLLGDNSSSRSDGANAHLSMVFQYRPLDLISLDITGTAYANRSEGVFNGWYPSYQGALSLNLKLKTFMLSIGATYYGFHRNLEHTQTLNTLSSELTLAYRLRDALNVSTTISGGFGKQRVYQPYDEALVSFRTMVGVQLCSKPDLWAAVTLGYSRYHFNSNQFERDQDNVWMNTSLTLKY